MRFQKGFYFFVFLSRKDLSLFLMFICVFTKFWEVDAKHTSFK